MNVYLIGYRGAGKTTLAPLLAARLGRPWIDLDDEVVRRAGRSVAAIFAESGEAAFRDMETAELAEVAATGGKVVSTGGGIVLRPENRKLLKQGKAVWLHAPEETLVARIERGSGRPPLTDLELDAEVATTLAARRPLYREVAGLEIDTGALAPAEAAERIALWLSRP
ncbi:MAG TPA: shikimate kinase [Planctomycetia bacterium]|nr:shikimate kinase [Planctomycetia bacterium]